MSTSITIAQVKLAAIVRESNHSTVARKVGSTPNTIRLLIHGAVKPNTRTVERFISLGILPGDWFSTVIGVLPGDWSDDPTRKPARPTGKPEGTTPDDVPGVESF